MSHHFQFQYAPTGHVMYEMVCRGRELVSAFPDDNDYHYLSGDYDLKQLLQLIFAEAQNDTECRQSLQNVRTPH